MELLYRMNRIEKFIAITVALSAIIWNIFEQILIATQGQATLIEPNQKIAWLELLILVVGGYLFLQMLNEPKKEENKNGQAEKCDNIQ